MLFNEYGLYQMIKLRQEEIEKKASNAWKYGDTAQESFFQKLLRKRNITQKSITIKPQNCGCTCQC